MTHYNYDQVKNLEVGDTFWHYYSNKYGYVEYIVRKKEMIKTIQRDMEVEIVKLFAEDCEAADEYIFRFSPVFETHKIYENNPRKRINDPSNYISINEAT